MPSDEHNGGGGDVDGNKRLDFVNQATCLTLGHSFPAVADAIRERSGKGTAFFGPSRYEVELAELLTDRIASMDHIRFCSSGMSCRSFGSVWRKTCTSIRTVGRRLNGIRISPSSPMRELLALYRVVCG